MFSGQAIEDFEISIHALREEGDLWSSCSGTRLWYFYPRPPRGGRPRNPEGEGQAETISIHALREEGDLSSMAKILRMLLFLSTPSARRATDVAFFRRSAILHFYPRPPRGGRRRYWVFEGRTDPFLSTPSARRATNAGQLIPFYVDISIHALREEGDLRWRIDQ